MDDLLPARDTRLSVCYYSKVTLGLMPFFKSLPKSNKSSIKVTWRWTFPLQYLVYKFIPLPYVKIFKSPISLQTHEMSCIRERMDCCIQEILGAKYGLFSDTKSLEDFFFPLGSSVVLTCQGNIEQPSELWKILQKSRTSAVKSESKIRWVNGFRKESE